MDWKKNYGAISLNTWKLPNVSERLVAAKRDLLEAGVPPEKVNSVTEGSLNHAWTLVSGETKKLALEARNGFYGNTGRPKSSRRKAAENNSAASSMLNLKSVEKADNIDLDEDEDFSDLTERKFEVSVESDPEMLFTEDASLFITSPMCSAALLEGARCDKDQTTILFVRVPSAGQFSLVGEPEFVQNSGLPPTEVLIKVSRKNMADLVEQILPPGSTFAQLEHYRQKLELEKSFGQHMSYEVVNNCYKFLAPPTEEWTVRAKIKEPYHFADITKAFILSSCDGRDCVFLFPLERDLPQTTVKRAKKFVADAADEPFDYSNSLFDGGMNNVEGSNTK